ncbi:MAG: hypothetical protein HY719_01090 [Planctomycetes bacterium]|nr:hypothetical protein [Planctomycetota bacterium]
MSGAGKVTLLFLFSIAAILVDAAVALLALFLAALLFAAACGVTRRRAAVVAGLIILSAAGMVTSQALFYEAQPRTAIAEIVPPSTPGIGALTGGVFVYREGMLHGLWQTSRAGATAVAGLAVAFSTPPREFLAAFRRLGLPRALAFVLLTAVRFLPDVAREAALVLRAQRARGARVLRWNVALGLMTAAQALRPIMASHLRRAGRVADALAVRGLDPFGGDAGARDGGSGAGGADGDPLASLAPPAPRSAGRRAAEAVILGVAVALVAAVAVCKLLTFFSSARLYDHETLRGLYAFTRLYL